MEYRLATPNADEAKEFSRQYREHFGVELSSQDALVVATHYLHMFQILTHEGDEEHLEQKEGEILHDDSLRS